MKASGKAGDMNDKALKQTIIPFAKVKVDEAQKGGAQVRALFHQTPHCAAPTLYDRLSHDSAASTTVCAGAKLLVCAGAGAQAAL